MGDNDNKTVRVLESISWQDRIRSISMRASTHEEHGNAGHREVVRDWTAPEEPTCVFSKMISETCRSQAGLKADGNRY